VRYIGAIMFLAGIARSSPHGPLFTLPGPDSSGETGGSGSRVDVLS
jgi:hypothetical protein